MSSRCRPLRRISLPCAALALATACGGKDAPPPTLTTSRLWPSPVVDTTATCGEVAALRVCWDESGAPRTATEAPLPGPAISPLGFRCAGKGPSRRCRDRAETAPPFVCEGKSCVQRHPRLPDDGEWECADMAGAVVCRGGDPPSGTAPGGNDESFVCGPRRIRGAPGPDRICVDLSPDLPRRRGGERCRFEVEGGRRRICTEDGTVHALGDSCDPARPCVDGSRCLGARCVPDRPLPSCWLDRDCEAGRCRFGSCVKEPP